MKIQNTIIKSLSALAVVLILTNATSVIAANRTLGKQYTETQLKDRGTLSQTNRNDMFKEPSGLYFTKLDNGSFERVFVRADQHGHYSLATKSGAMVSEPFKLSLSDATSMYYFS